LFPATANPPGNYWIVDLSPDYDGPNGWAIVSDPTGFTGFLLSRTPIVSDQLYQELLDRASVKGVRGWITRTRQPGAPTGVATGLPNTEATLALKVTRAVNDPVAGGTEDGVVHDGPDIFRGESVINAPVARVGASVTGVKTGSAVLDIPCEDGYTAPADWYFPTQADGTVAANGLIWLQHGSPGFNTW